MLTPLVVVVVLGWPLTVGYSPWFRCKNPSVSKCVSSAVSVKLTCEQAQKHAAHADHPQLHHYTRYSNTSTLKLAPRTCAEIEGEAAAAWLHRSIQTPLLLLLLPLLRLLLRSLQVHSGARRRLSRDARYSRTAVSSALCRWRKELLPSKFPMCVRCFLMWRTN